MLVLGTVLGRELANTYVLYRMYIPERSRNRKGPLRKCQHHYHRTICTVVGLCCRSVAHPYSAYPKFQRGIDIPDLVLHVTFLSDPYVNKLISMTCLYFHLSSSISTAVMVALAQ